MENEENKSIFMKDGRLYRNQFDAEGNVVETIEIEEPTEQDFEELEAVMEAEVAAAAAAAAEVAPSVPIVPIEDSEEENKNIFMKDGKMYRNKVDIGGNVIGVEEVENPTEEDFEELEAAMAEAEAEAAARAAAVAEEVAEPVAEEVAETVAEEVAEPVAEEVAEEVAEAVAEPVAEEVAEPVAEEVAEPVAEEVAEPVAEEVAEPVAEEVAEPVAEEVAEEVAETVAEEVAEPVAEEVAEAVAEEVAETVAEEVAETVAEEVAETVAEEVAEPVAEEVAETVAEEVAEPVAEPVAEAVAEEVAEPVAEEVAEPVAEEVAEPVAEEVAEPVAEHVAEEVAETVAEEVAEEVAEPVAEEVAEPVAEEVAEPVAEEEAFEETADAMQSESSYYKEELKKPIRKKNAFSRFIAATLIVSVAGGASIGAGYGYVKYSMETPETVTKVPVVAQPVVSQAQSQTPIYSAVEVIKAVKPTVVSISTQTVGQTQYFGTFTIPYESQSAGSGVVFYSDNDRVAIATNNHVIDNTTEIFVTFDEDITVPAKVVGTKSESDLAVIVVNWDDLEAQEMYNVSVATFGDSDILEVGSPVFAIGNAMGEGISATDGIISMTEQSIIIDESQLSVLQTSAAINGGNSGGALVNASGEVIGINTAKYNPLQAEGMGYAIPSNEFVPIIEDLLLNGTMPKPYIGVTGTSITTENAVLYRLPVGALIMEVVEGGPADLAGLMVGDIVTQVNGKTVMGMETLITIVNELEVGTAVDVHVVRDTSESVDLTLVVGDKNSQ